MKNLTSSLTTNKETGVVDVFVSASFDAQEDAAAFHSELASMVVKYQKSGGQSTSLFGSLKQLKLAAPAATPTATVAAPTTTQ